MTGSKIIFAYK